MFASEKFESHKCELTFTANKEIPVVYYRDDSYGDKKSVTALGIDGVLYTFEVVPRKPIPIVAFMRNLTTVNMNPETDDKLTEPVLPIYRGGIVFSEH